MIKKGDRFKCIKTVIMDNNPNDIAYRKGKFYVSDYDGCITDENEFKGHSWSERKLSEYFIKVDNIKKESKVEHPSHYTWLKDLCGIEVIDITRHMNFNLGNCIKYVLRAGHKSEEGYTEKDKTIEDLEKAIFYIKDEIERIKNDKEKV